MTTVGLKPGSRKAGSALALLTEPQLIELFFCLIIVLILCNSHLIVLLPLLCVMAAFLSALFLLACVARFNEVCLRPAVAT